mgnify:CR=1 FL=1
MEETIGLQQEIMALLEKDDCIGSLNYYNQKFYGMLVMDNKSYQKLASFFEEKWSHIIIRKTPLEKRSSEME